MRLRSNGSRTKVDDQGSALLMMAAFMVAMLGVSALAVDLVQFYAVRAEAQRAADAAALGGAQMLLASGCTSASGGCQLKGSQEGPAIQRAKDLAAQNLVAGQGGYVLTSDITFTYPNPEEPQITVVVARDAAHGNAMPAIFGKIFGVQTVAVSATSTAEAFSPSGTGTPVGSSCLKPWILPNCDSNHTTPNTNPNCPSGVAPFIDPTTGALLHPGPASSGGIAGESLLLKPGSSSAAPAPSQYYAVDLVSAGGASFFCPTCSNGGSSGTGGALYRTNIECCNPTPVACGELPISLETGALQGPTQQGVSCLINEQNNGHGQDVLVSASPLSITGGSSNPNPLLQGATGLTQSSSIATIPLYDGHDLSSGGSTVDVIGFLQVFINNVTQNGGNQGNVTATVLNISGCGSAGGSGGGSSTGIASSGGAVPVRLIHQ